MGRNCCIKKQNQARCLALRCDAHDQSPSRTDEGLIVVMQSRGRWFGALFRVGVQAHEMSIGHDRASDGETYAE